jgi:hypothetical protein
MQKSSGLHQRRNNNLLKSGFENSFNNPAQVGDDLQKRFNNPDREAN